MSGAKAKPRGRLHAATGPVVVRRVGESAWILRPTDALLRDVVDALRDVFLEVVDSGAQNVVIDLSSVDAVAPSGAETIVAMADLMCGRNATLWLAARRPDGNGHALRAIDDQGRGALVGLSAALDLALEQSSLDDTARIERAETLTSRRSRRHRSESAAQTPSLTSFRSENAKKRSRPASKRK